MWRTKLLDSFDFNDNFAIANEIRFVRLDEASAFVR